MKRALLIAGGTVGGLGAVLAITPPQLGSSGISTLAGASADTSANNSNTTNSASNSNTAVASATPSASASKAATATKSATKTDNTAVVTPQPTQSAMPAGINGAFTGDVFDAWNYGRVQVKITVENGKVTEAVAIQSPSGRSQRYSDYAIPNLRQQTLSAQSAAISGVGGASYTSYAWYKSLISALQKAGMPTGV
jgi:uncharacterized protein with FMN-binding domain